MPLIPLSRHSSGELSIVRGPDLDLYIGYLRLETGSPFTALIRGPERFPTLSQGLKVIQIFNQNLTLLQTPVQGLLVPTLNQGL